MPIEMSKQQGFVIQIIFKSNNEQQLTQCNLIFQINIKETAFRRNENTKSRNTTQVLLYTNTKLKILRKTLSVFFQRKVLI